MSKKKKLALALMCADIIFIAICIAGDWLQFAILVNVLAILMLAGLIFANKVLLKSNWFKNIQADYEHEIYPDNTWYRKHDERNYDLVNLGSSSSVYAFDYTGTGIKAMNWALQPQTLHYDFKLLKQFHSILKKHGVVLISIMPFTSINKTTGLSDAVRYMNPLWDEMIDPEYRRKARWMNRYPVLMGKPAIKAFIKCLIGRDKRNVRQHVEKNPMSQNELKENAKRWADGWMNQFHIADLTAPLTEENARGRRIRIRLMQDIVDFCTEREYQPVFVILPMTKHMMYYLNDDFKKIYIYDYLQELNRDVPTLDYTIKDKFADDSLYRDAYMMNNHGARVFTDDVVKELRKRSIL